VQDDSRQRQAATPSHQNSVSFAISFWSEEPGDKVELMRRVWRIDQRGIVMPSSPRLALAGVCFTLACLEGNQPVRTGYGDLRFGDIGLRRQSVTKLDLFLASPFDQWSWSGTQLIGNPTTATGPTWDLTAQSIIDAPSLSPIWVSYAHQHAFWQTLGRPSRDFVTQHEVVLFARDPEEFYSEIASVADDTNYDDRTRWDTKINTSRIPDAATMLYPPQENWQYTDQQLVAQGGRVVEHNPLHTCDFWQCPVIPSGPAAAPLVPNFAVSFPAGGGSVKSARLIDKGLCAQFQAYQSVVSRA